MCNIALVDDHNIVREGIKSVLRNLKQIKIIRDFGSALDLMSFLQKANAIQDVDVVVTDISMPEMNGIELTAEIKARYPQLKVLVLTMHDEEEFINKAIQAGADGYLLKDFERSELVKALDSLMSGKKYFNHEISNVLISSLFGKTKTVETVHRDFDLTEREKEVLRYIVKGYSNKMIADELFISCRTVDAHRYRLMQKMDVKNTAEMVRVALENKIISFSYA